MDSNNDKIDPAVLYDTALKTFGSITLPLRHKDSMKRTISYIRMKRRSTVPTATDNNTIVAGTVALPDTSQSTGTSNIAEPPKSAAAVTITSVGQIATRSQTTGCDNSGMLPTQTDSNTNIVRPKSQQTGIDKGTEQGRSATVAINIGASVVPKTSLLTSSTRPKRAAALKSMHRWARK